MTKHCALCCNSQGVDQLHLVAVVSEPTPASKNDATLVLAATDMRRGPERKRGRGEQHFKQVTQLRIRNLSLSVHIVGLTNPPAQPPHEFPSSQLPPPPTGPPFTGNLYQELQNASTGPRCFTAWRCKRGTPPRASAMADLRQRPVGAVPHRRLLDRCHQRAQLRRPVRVCVCVRACVCSV